MQSFPLSYAPRMSRVIGMSKRIMIYKGKDKPARVKSTKSATLVGKTVFFKNSDNGPKIAGVVKSQEGSVLEVALAVPNSCGVLIVCKDALTHTLVEHCDVVDAVTKQGNVKNWNSNTPIKNLKAAQEIKDGDVIVDYRDVTFEGYGSTFASTTPEDRDGDNILPNAFDNSLRRFKENPCMLSDHMRSVGHMMGHYSHVSVNERGLALQGAVTNSPHPDAQHVRFLIVEGSLKTLSIGGAFYYQDDYRTIEEIEIHETSLVVIPANPDATFIAKAIDAAFAEKAFTFHTKNYGGEVRAK